MTNAVVLLIAIIPVATSLPHKVNPDLTTNVEQDIATPEIKMGKTTCKLPKHSPLGLIPPFCFTILLTI